MTLKANTSCTNNVNENETPCKARSFVTHKESKIITEIVGIENR